MDSPRVHKFLLRLCLALTLVPSVAALNCYSRDGVLATSSRWFNTNQTLIACGDESEPTTCCFEGQYCTSDLLCHDKEGGGLSRQYCSDPTWPSDKCSAVCPDYTGAGVSLVKCNSSGTKFCCGTSSDCCKDNTYTEINKSNGQIVAIGTSSVVPSSSATPSPSASSSSAAEASATTTDAAADANSAGSGSGGLTEQAKLGIGLGVGLGVPFLIAIAAALFLWRRSLLSQAQANGNAGGGDNASSPDQMAKVGSAGFFAPANSPGNEYGYSQGTNPSTSVVAATPGTPGQEAELENNPAAHQLDAGRNTLSEIGDSRRVYELH